jgi:hypothetical protein
VLIEVMSGVVMPSNTQAIVVSNENKTDNVIRLDIDMLHPLAF